MRSEHHRGQNLILINNLLLVITLGFFASTRLASLRENQAVRSGLILQTRLLVGFQMFDCDNEAVFFLLALVSHKLRWTSDQVPFFIIFSAVGAAIAPSLAFKLPL